MPAALTPERMGGTKENCLLGNSVEPMAFITEIASVKPEIVERHKHLWTWLSPTMQGSRDTINTSVPLMRIPGGLTFNLNIRPKTLGCLQFIPLEHASSF